MLLFALVCLFVQPVLRLTASSLVVSHPIQKDDHILVLNGDRCFETAARLGLDDTTRKVLRISAVNHRLQIEGILPTDDELFLTEMQRRGLPPSQVELLPNPDQQDWEDPETLSIWLKEDPARTVAALCDAFKSARLHCQLKQAIGDDADRVHFVPLFDRDVSTDNWWRSREGIRKVTFGWIELLDSWFRRPSAVQLKPTWNPDDYQAHIEKQQLDNESTSPPSAETNEGMLSGFARWLDVGERARPVDYLVVMPGDEKTRPFAAAAFYRAGLAGEFVIPTPARRPEQVDGILPETAEVIRRVLIARGVPENRIHLLEGASDKTMDDARLVARFLKEFPDSRMGVITSDYHTRRTRFVFQKVFPDRLQRLSVFSVPSEQFEMAHWWKSSRGTRVILSEFLKLGLYWGWYGRGKFLAAASVLLLTGIWYRRRMRVRSRSQHPTELPAEEAAVTSH